ncbi:MAG: Ger(x)C family spore germination protein [Thermobacillus sp.]|uniref:Ger(x)C family spore germination protein n=1 Tax=Thermobacillus sp. TaxID=2108467 RepID=UPI000E39D15D|nr:Ger(x)C family spore germination protein [Thermobacillus sp.]REK54249.1 MAG: Ger(x)C family spore germination protein [Thermobacillus sp.]
MSRRQRAAAAVLALCAALLTSCWDKVEINDLSLVSLAGLDRDPESGIYTVYLQVINPATGASAQGAPGGEQAPVYTYAASGKSLAEAQVTFYKLLPRRMFLHHTKAVLISERAAKQGMRDFLNFSELQPDARTSIPLLVVDGSIDEVMRTFTPLDWNPADAITSRLNLLHDYAMMTGRRIELRDVIERTEREELIVIPLISATPKTGDHSNWDVKAEINANRNQLKLGRRAIGAVIENYRMVGRLYENDLIMYHVLIGEKGQFVRRFPFRGGHITVIMKTKRMERRLDWKAGKPVVRLRLRLEFSTIAMKEYFPQTLDELKKLEQHLNQVFAEELTTFVDKTRRKGWDLLRIRSLLHRKAPNLPDPDQAASEAEIKIEVETRLRGMGNLGRLYDGAGGEP